MLKPFIASFGPVMLFFLGIICIFLMFSRAVNHRSKKQKENWEDYLQEDNAANFVRKKKIPSDILLTIDMNKIPKLDFSEAITMWDHLKSFEELPMCNLANATNLDLKKQFGYEGLQLLIHYEQTYLVFIQVLVDYGILLKENGYLEEGLLTFEYAISIGCDLRSCYLNLIALYSDMELEDKLVILREKIVDLLQHSIYLQDMLNTVDTSLQTKFKKV